MNKERKRQTKKQTLNFGEQSDGYRGEVGREMRELCKEN